MVDNSPISESIMVSSGSKRVLVTIPTVKDSGTRHAQRRRRSRARHDALGMPPPPRATRSTWRRSFAQTSSKS